MKNLMIIVTLLLLPLCLTAHPSHGDDVTKSYVEQVVAAKQQGKPLPLLSSRGHFTETTGYLMQQGMVNFLKTEDPVIGYKAGLTSAGGQAKFNVDGPLMGALFSSGKWDANQPIQIKNYHKLMLETEIGFILSQDIQHPVSKDSVLTYVAAVVPVIELPNLAYPNVKKLTGVDLIATNVASNAVIIGSPITDFSALDLNQLTTQLTRGDQLIIEGKGSDASGDQLTALTWLINRILNQGYTLEKGHLLITGALGPMVPAIAGQHTATFGSLGSIEFNLQ